MWKRFLLLPVLALGPGARAQTEAPGVEVANLREDVRELSQRVADLGLRIEQLESENSALKAKERSAGQGYATTAQLADAVADLNRVIQSSEAASKADILQQVSIQLEKLGRQTNAALDALSKGQAPRPAASAAFSDNFPKEGVKYTVQKGETLAEIAKKTGSKVQDIINANRISDPEKIFAGQTLFIPGGK
ncbi:MAG: LysM peptidoglycan-binding domain-containing protein [Opitutaceae bacterium]